MITDRETAERLFQLAEQHRTPLFSSSALRFARNYENAEHVGIEMICSLGPGTYNNYAVHQIEPIIMMMGTDVRRVMYIGTEKTPAL